jgi:CelD/BcsL family acetyltransferase involved in cellulose biosynthesis
MNSLTTRHWSLEEWQASEASWNSLMARSDADALFMSWHWLTHWWTRYGTPLGLEAQIMAFYRGGDLVGLAPLYQRAVVRGRLVKARSIQMIGYAFRDPVPLISEYLDVIAAPGDLAEVRDACVSGLHGRWSELVVGFTPAAQGWKDSMARAAPRRSYYARELDRSVSYHADLSAGFPAYLKQLGQSTRRSVWNLRKRLNEEHGEVRFEFVAPAEIPEAFEDLNRLHQLRWNRPAFSGDRLEFHKTFALGLAERGELALTRLRVSGKTVSVLYDIRKSRRQYNMKMSFDPALTTRLSVGLVHFGYAMEAAAESGMVLYDFLAGRGQNADFKGNLGQIQRKLSCVQVVRGWRLVLLYRWRDRIRKA